MLVNKASRYAQKRQIIIATTEETNADCFRLDFVTLVDTVFCDSLVELELNLLKVAMELESSKSSYPRHLLLLKRLNISKPPYQP